MVSGHLRAYCALATHTLPTDDLHMHLLAAQLLALLHLAVVVAQSHLLHFLLASNLKIEIIFYYDTFLNYNFFTISNLDS